MKIGKLTLGNTPKIAAVIVDGEDKKAISAAKRDGADLLELRIDCFKKRDALYIQKIIKDIKAVNLPVIATIRSKVEGGKAAISDNARLGLFETIIPFVDAVDIELSSRQILKDIISQAHRFNKKVLVSYHNFKNTPEQKKLEAIIKNSKKAGSDIVKIATFARDKKDIIRLASLTVSHENIITIAMGRLGTLSRLLFPMLGSLITYCSVTKSSAPGQISLNDSKMLLEILKEAY